MYFNPTPQGDSLQNVILGDRALQENSEVITGSEGKTWHVGLGLPLPNSA